jgi:molybdopterin/thiamine biosynthesis adenylyltransferase/rhodanese-related sulfurtransferase
MVADLSQDEILRYSRHLVIPEVGLEGQKKLNAASILVVGAGGLGSPILLYLAAAGIGKLGIVDYDLVEESNLQRQILHSTKTLLKPKVKSAQERLKELNPFCQVEGFNEVFCSETAEKIAKGYDILVDGTDNFPTRYLLNDLAVLTHRPYVYGSVFRFEGQASVFDAQKSGCYRCMFPQPPKPGTVPGCADGGVFGVMPGIIGLIQATEVLKLILGIGDSLVGKLMLVDALSMEFQTVKLAKNPDCPICGEHPTIHKLMDYEQFCGVPVVNGHPNLVAVEHEISPEILHQKMKKGEKIHLVDVRTPIELQVCSIPGSEFVPLEQLATKMKDWNKEEILVFYCRVGNRSAQAVEQAISTGFKHVYNLTGGINAWGMEVDQSMNRY